MDKMKVYTSEKDSLAREVLPALQLGAGTLLLMEAITALLTCLHLCLYLYLYLYLYSYLYFLLLESPCSSVPPSVPPSVTEKYRIIYSQSIVYSQCTMQVSLGLSARRARRTSQEAQRASS